MKKKVWLITIPVVLLLIGCGLSLETIEQIEDVAGLAEVATPIVVGGAATIFPQVAGIAGLVGISIGWVIGLWKKLNPVLKVAKENAETYYGVTDALVSSIEGFKEEHPKEWLLLEKKICGCVGDRGEAVIRALRGLPPKA